MFAVSNGFIYVAFLIFIAGGVLVIEKYTQWKVFNIIPPLVWIYLLNMVFCTMGLYPDEVVLPVYSTLKDSLLHALIFIMLLRCDFRKLAQLGPRIIAVFFGCSITLGIGVLVGYPIFMGGLGGVENTWAAVAGLYAFWVGGAGNMTSMAAAFGGALNEGAFGAALALDTVCYSIWIAILLLGVRYADKWNQSVKSDAAALTAVAAAVNAGMPKSRRRASAADWTFLVGLSLVVSYLAQEIGILINSKFGLFDPAVCTTLFVTVLGLVCALTPLGRIPASEELSGVYLYAIVALLASHANLSDLTCAPIWVLYGLVILLIHFVLMFALSKLFHWDLCTVSTASLANIGGAASAHIVATTYDASFAAIGVLMGLLGGAVGNFFGLGMGALLQVLFL